MVNQTEVEISPELSRQHCISLRRKSEQLNIVGISAGYHDSACCLLQDGVLTAAAQEERFSRVKHDKAFPRQAFRYCLREAGLTISDIDCIAYYEDPCRKLSRQIWMHGPALPKSRSILRRMDPARPEREIREI